MHAYRRFIQTRMDDRGWKAVDLAKASGISKQVLSNALSDSRETLQSLPSPQTIDGLARAFGVDRNVVLHSVAEAMGLPTSEPVTIYDASRVPNEDLLREIARRLGNEGSEEHAGSPSNTQALANGATQKDVTLAADPMPPGGSMKQRFDRAQDEAAEAPDDIPDDDFPA